MKVSELEGAELDYWVAKIYGFKDVFIEDGSLISSVEQDYANGILSTKPDEIVNGFILPYKFRWEHIGPIIEREKIDVCYLGNGNGADWYASKMLREVDGAKTDFHQYADTPLIAAMRCFISYRFGDTVPGDG